MAKSPMFSAQTIKRFNSVHSWIGIATGMSLFIAFYAGALTMYRGEMHLWANPGLRQTSGGMADVDRMVVAVGAERGAEQRFQVAFDASGHPVASYSEGGGRGGGRSFRQSIRVLDDEGTIVPRKAVSSVEHFINYIHYTLGLPKEPGYTLMGVVSAVYFLALITGVLIHLPHLMSELYALRVGRNLKKMWLDAHNAIGILSLPFHLMFAFTAMLVCIGYVMPGLIGRTTPTDAPLAAYEQVNGEGEGGRGGRGGGRGGPRAPEAVMLPASQLISIATGRLPGFEPTGITFAQYGTVKAKATVEGNFPEALISSGSIEVSPIDGRVGRIDAAETRTAPRAIEDAYTFLHFGDFGGQMIRALYFVMGLGGAFLFYSGNLLWIETKRRRRHAEQPMAGWILAQLTVGTCLGCCFGIAVMLIGVPVLPLDLPERGQWESGLYFAGFFGALIWSLARPPIRAAIELLWGCTIAYLSLPVLNALLTPDNLIATLWRGPADVAVIDALMLAMGIGFGAVARATTRRSRSGQPNSVWSLTSWPERKSPDGAPVAGQIAQISA